MTSIVILILYPAILCPLHNSFQVKGPRSQDRFVSQRTRFQGMASTRVACAIFFSLKNVASSLSLLFFPLSLVTSAAVSVLYLTTKVIMDSSRERSRSPANLVLWRWCWKTSDSGSGTGNGFQSRTAGYARKRLYPIPRTCLQLRLLRTTMLLQHAVKLRHLGSASVAILPEGGKTAN